MEYREYIPHPLLRQYVECYWSADADKPPFQQKESLIPDGTIEFMFNFSDGYFHHRGNDTSEVKGAHIIGIRKQSLSISQPGRQQVFSIRFRTGGVYPFFRIPVANYAADIHNMQDVVGNDIKELEEQLYLAKDHTARVCIANRFLLRRLNESDNDYLFIKRCVPAILKGAKLKEVVSDFNVSYKYIERKFDAVLGLTPTELVKIYRFNNAVKSMYAGQHSSLTSVAHASGYFDQAHFIRDFKQLTNYSPKEFLKAQFTIVQVIQPALAERLSKLYNF